MNNSVKAVLKGTDCSLFVDDFAVCLSGKTWNRVERVMQLCVNRVQKWVSENGFKFSTSKTICIHGKTPIKVVKEAKFLGLIFDTKLTFKNHIQYLKTSCQKALDIFRVVGHTDWGADRIVLLRLYRSLVRSKLDALCKDRPVGRFWNSWIRSTTRAYVSRWVPSVHLLLKVCI